MSDIPLSDQGQLSLAEVVGRINRQQEETRKFVSEQHKLIAEAVNLNAEAVKLASESRKFDRDRWLAPWLALAAVIGGSLGFATFIAHLLVRN